MTMMTAENREQVAAELGRERRCPLLRVGPEPAEPLVTEGRRAHVGEMLVRHRQAGFYPAHRGLVARHQVAQLGLGLPRTLR